MNVLVLELKYKLFSDDFTVPGKLHPLLLKDDHQNMNPVSCCINSRGTIISFTRDRQNPIIS